MTQSSTDSQDLVEEHRTYCEKIVSRLMRAMSLPAEMRDELISAGYLGLVEAASRFDRNSGKKFSSFAYLRIRGAVIDYLRDNGEISGKAYKMAKAYRAANDFREELEQDSSVNSLEDVFELSAGAVMVYRLSYDEFEHGVEDEDSQSEEPDAQYDRKEFVEVLRSKIDELPQKEADIVRKHYFQGMTFKEIVESNEQYSKSWVSRLHTRALKRLSELCVEEYGEGVW